MSRRNYNVFFNTHTVSGIVISIGLYVIFLAGAFSLFMESIDHWESNEKPHEMVVLDYDKAIAQATAAGYDMHGRNLRVYEYDGQVFVRAPALGDPALQKSDLGLLPDSVAAGAFTLPLHKQLYLKTDTKKNAPQETLGNFLYELHFFEQIPTAGRYLSGLVSIFFLFATITGIIVHWNKIIPNFFTFRLKASLKNLWTDAHTALGVIGLPFQIMYAVTGAIFCLLVLFSIPMAEIVYEGDTEAMYNDIYPAYQDGHIAAEGYHAADVSINAQIQQVLSQFAEDQIKSVYAEVHNYHDQNAHLEMYVETHQIEGFFNYAKYVYHLPNGKLVEHKAMDTAPPYATASWDFIHLIHFGNYGGILIKILYFLMALLTCFVIISGVMIWLTARDKKAYLSKAKFNKNVVAIYLGACLGLYPAIALLFLLTKTFPADMAHRFTWISWLFLAFWVGYSIYAYLIKDNFRINRNALVLAGVMGILIPVFNGFHSGLWFWKSLGMGYLDSFWVDLSWLGCGSVTLYVAFRIKPQEKKEAQVRARSQISFVSSTLKV